MQLDRVVPVIQFVNGQRWVGSGYRVARLLVLTAAHCVRGTGHRVWLEHGEQAARVVADGSSAGVDLALIEISQPGGDDQTAIADVAPTPGARVDRMTSGTIAGCEAVGYPKHAARSDAPFTTAQVNGWIPVGSGLIESVQGRRAGFLVLKAEGAPPRPLPTSETELDKTPWAGMSGAAVFAADKLVGVVAEHHLPEGDGSLTIVPIEWVQRLADEDRARFLAALGAASVEEMELLKGGRSTTGAIQDSIIAGGDIEISVNIIDDAGVEQPPTRNLSALVRRLNEALPQLDPVQATSARAVISRLEKAISELPSGERNYLQRISDRLAEDQPYYVPLSAETTELGQQSDSVTAWRHSARRRQRRAVADYCEWIPAQREIMRIKLDNLEEGVNKYPCIILLGDPGGGKTTALDMIALSLAQAGLTAGNNEPPMLPIPLRLSEYEPGMDFEEFIIQGWSGSLVGDHWDASDLAANLHGYLDDGRLFFLLDAMNEMPREGYTERVVHLRQFIDHWQAKGNRFMVTCRVLDYSEELQGLQRIEIMPLSDVQIQLFIMSEITSGDRTSEVLWGLYLGAQTEEERDRILIQLDAELKRTGLIQQWETLQRALVPEGASDDSGLLEMARNPYLLTVIIDVFLAEGSLNLTRSQLMGSFVNIQLNWARSKVSSPDWLDTTVQQESLAVLAFETQRRTRFGTVVRTDQVKAVMPQLVQPDPNWPPVPAPPEKVLNLAASANIIEMPADRSTVRFYHQLLQEYFAARSLLKRDFGSLPEIWRWPWRRSEMPEVGQRGEYEPLPPPPATGWEETTILATELANGQHSALLGKIVDVNPVLAARCIVETQTEVEADTREAIIAALLRTISDSDVSLRVRISAGDVLGKLGDPRVGKLVTIPAGSARIGFGTDSHEMEIRLPEYQMGIVPVTNSEYVGFIEAGGYENPDWWTEAGWQWKNNTRLPDDWGNAWFSGPNYPIVGISWYEAAAYCRWLSAEVGHTVRLPTEEEWEKAAGGEAGCRFPWGVEFDAERANIRVGNDAVNRTTPVGLYSSGTSPYGLLDCAGQVWEWCLTPTTADYQLAPYGTGEPLPADIEEGDLGRILRGGSWSDRAKETTECAHREWFYADFRAYDRGFRIVMVQD
jgi:formylglycine-generating enzyme required for sulfatase activity